MLVTQCWWPNVGDIIFGWWHQNLDICYTISDFVAQNKSAFKTLIYLQNQKLTPTFCVTNINAGMTEVHRIPYKDIRFKVWLFPFISCHVSLLHEHISIAITISTGHPSSVWACDVQHDSSHSHMPGYVVSWPRASHEAFYRVIFIGELIKLTSVSLPSPLEQQSTDCRINITSSSPIISCGKSTAFVRPKPINRLKALIFRPKIGNRISDHVRV